MAPLPLVLGPGGGWQRRRGRQSALLRP